MRTMSVLFWVSLLLLASCAPPATPAETAVSLPVSANVTEVPVEAVKEVRGVPATSDFQAETPVVTTTLDVAGKMGVANVEKRSCDSEQLFLRVTVNFSNGVFEAKRYPTGGYTDIYQWGQELPDALPIGWAATVAILDEDDNKTGSVTLCNSDDGRIKFVQE